MPIFPLNTDATITAGGAIDFAAIRRELSLPERFPARVSDEVRTAVSGPLPGGREDATAIPLVTIDPPGARDLDQAMCLRRLGDGFRVHYAIADLGAFVIPEGALDSEVRLRGQTFYLPDSNVPLHPRELSEDVASLLPGRTRPAVLWTFDLDADAEPVRVDVRRALVRSTARFDYAGVQADIDAGRAHPSVAALPDFGRLRRRAAVARGAVELQLPEQEIVPDGTGWRLMIRQRHTVDAWNAELSLLTGMAAARIMLDAGTGLLRTLPVPDDGVLARVRRSADALGLSWPDDQTPAEFLSALDPAVPAVMALYSDATSLLRGAGYTVFDGAAPEVSDHAGIGAPYTHVTAPLRRLVDRYTAEICLAVTAGREIPDWVQRALPRLPEAMRVSDSRASRVERTCLDAAEASAMLPHVGRVFDAVVLHAGERSADVLVLDPPVIGRVRGGGLVDGTRTRVRLTAADPVRRKVTLTTV